MSMNLTAWTTLLALGVYGWTGANAARARVKFKVKAPSMDGPLPFQCAQRVHLNTLEQLPLFLPPLWMCAMFLGDRWAAAGGVLWCIGRIMYALAYYKDPAKREAGYIVSAAACGLLIAGTCVGLFTQ
jgi:glutathione S-transferase